MRRNPPTRHLGAFAAAAALVVPATMAASSPAPSNLPAIDFDMMGQVGLGGSFSGLDWHTAQSPFASGSNTTTFSHTGDTLVMRNADGTLTVLGSTNDGGHIAALCRSGGTVYVGGEFSSLGSIKSPNIIAYSVDESKFVTLATGLSGPVETVYCDDSHKEVWAGGQFNAPEGTGGNVARWSTDSSSWASVPFGGFNGRVDHISSSTDGNSVYFGGEFTTLYADNRNQSALRSLASLPIAPPNTATIGNSGYLTPFTIPAAASQYGGLTVSASPSSGDAAHDNANNILCPDSGTWYARDQSIATVHILANAYLSVAGVRISNGRTDGRAVKEFTLTTLPDNTVRKLKFSDNGSEKTCNPSCSLSTSTDVSAQDFLFEDGLISITGLSISLDSWDGASSALDYVQLLSDGAYASYVESDNEGVCGKSNSTVNTIGNWTSATAPSNISGTEIGYMTSTVPVNTQEDLSLTLKPYVGSAGFYDIYLVIPGCANIGDCASRTTADISVFPLEGAPPWTSTIDERVQTDTSVLIYSGLVDATSSNFNPTIHIALPANPAPISGDHYVIVASGVQMTLTGLSDGTESPYNQTTTTSSQSQTSTGTVSSGTTSPTTSSAATTSSPIGAVTTTASRTQSSATSTRPSSTTSTSAVPTTTSLRRAFGVYEWKRSNTNQTNAANSILPNSTETLLTELGFSIDTAYNASSSKDFKVHTVVPAGSTVFVGGKFALAKSYSNVVLVDTALGATALANSGLNGAVHTGAAVGDNVYFGGEFTGTAQGDTQLSYLAKYDPNAKAWSPVAGGVDGPVLSITAIDNDLHVAGNFTNVLTANGTTTSTGGYAVFDTNANDWKTSGVIYGPGSAVTSASNGTYIGGRFLGASRNPVSGVARLVIKDGVTYIETLEGVTFSHKGSASSTSTATRRSVSYDWFSHLRRALHIARADTPAVPEVPEEAPATLAGAYWKNSSAKGEPKITIIGGNFSSGSDISGVAFQGGPDGMTGPKPPVSGVVRSLLVFDNTLYVGGSNLNVPEVGSGLLAYNLQTGSWDRAIPLNGNGEVTVNALQRREGSNTIVVAGNFVTANNGTYPCPGVCLWDRAKRQWSQPGRNGTISSGEVRAIDFGDDQLGTLVAGGSFVLNGATTYAAQYSFANNSWSALGTLPGPVLSLVVNAKNLSSIFASGIDSSTSKPYLHSWDGSTWSAQNTDALSPGTVIQQLAIVPLREGHSHNATGAIQDDRMLMASGDINLSSGNVSSALYDGTQWHPYLVGTTSKGTLGAISSFFYENKHFSFNRIKYLARGLVVLVAMAIATGLILILILLILLGAYCVRRHERKQQPVADTYDEKEQPGSEASSTHQLIHNSVQTALERSLMQPSSAGQSGAGVAGIGAGTAGAAAAAGLAGRRESSESQFHDADDEYAAGQYADDSDEGRETVMRYDFFGPELQAGELPMRAGQRVIVLDDEQSDEWWYCRDPETGREGVVPATYLL